MKFILTKQKHKFCYLKKKTVIQDKNNISNTCKVDFMITKLI